MCVKWLQQDLVPVRHHLSSDAEKSSKVWKVGAGTFSIPLFICIMWENANCARDLSKTNLHNWPRML